MDDTNRSGALGNFLECGVTGHIVTTRTSARRLGYVSMTVTFADRSTHLFGGTAADNRAIDRLPREAGIAARIDRIVWLGCDDISKAEIDVAAAAPVFGLSAPEATSYQWGALHVGLDVGPSTDHPRPETALNKAICDGVTAAKRAKPTAWVMCTTWTDPNVTGSGDIEDTVTGGMPHPARADSASTPR